MPCVQQQARSAGTVTSRFPLFSALPRGVIVGWLIAVVLAWTLAELVAAGLIAKSQKPQATGAVAALSRWDGEHYAKIAAEGYHTEGDARREFNFYPAFPAIARLLGGRTHAPLAGIIFNQLLYLVSLALLTRLSGNTNAQPLREQPAFWLLVSPFSFFSLLFSFILSRCS